MKGLRVAFAPVLAMMAIAGSAANATPYRYHWECVPFAREMSGIQIFGNARTWWGQAAGKYDRGHEPRLGSVLAFKPYGSMSQGHVAMVSQIVDDRTVKLTHANWSLINGRRGQVERDVTAIDVSEAGDWSRVKVWYAPSQDLGTTSWPTHGFIYPGATQSYDEPKTAPVQIAYINSHEIRPTGRLDGLGKLLNRLKDEGAR